MGNYFQSKILSNVFFLVLLANVPACMQSRKSGNLSDFNDTSPFGNIGGNYQGGGANDLINAVDDSDPNSRTTTAVGSASDGGLTDADKQALRNLIQSTEEVLPADGTNLISESLKAELKRLLDDEKKGRDVAVQKMALAQKMMAECAARVAALAPVPGQPLMGTWGKRGNTQCGGDFTVNGAGPLKPQPTPVYAVSGKTQGKLTAKSDGTGTLQGSPSSGNVRDTPTAAEGVLRHENFFPASKNAAARPCDWNATLKTSSNPIPENYKEATRRAGACFRQTLILISPVMDGLFKSMDPNLAALLQQRMLGITR